MIVACGQMNANTIDYADAVWPVVDRLADSAAAGRADLLVLPETTYPAYWLESADRYLQRDIERSAAVLERFSSIAARHRFWLVVGFVEECDDRLYNSAAVFDRAGSLVGVARKNFLWDCDNRWFAPGERLGVFDTEFGRMGVMICADGRPPEIAATLAARGAEFIVVPTAWVNGRPFSGVFSNAQADFIIRARALEFGVPFACCSKSGREDRHLEYVGQSRLVSATGELIAAAPIEGDKLIVGEIVPAVPRPPALDDRQRERLLGREPPSRPEPARGPCTLSLDADIGDVVTAVGQVGQVVSIREHDLPGIATARCHAHDGAHDLDCRGGSSVDDAVLRARATENRVFIILGDDRVQRIADPAGQLIVASRHPERTVTLDLQQADIKRFTPETDLWAQRRPACYELGACQRPSSTATAAPGRA